jgi:ribosomal protein S18 acetylase RimI-like enzyme
VTESPALTIRRATSEDAKTLATLGARVFHDTFAAHNTAEDMRAYLDEAYSEATCAEELADPELITLLAEIGDQAVAYAQLQFGPAPAFVSGEAPAEIKRFYVDHGWHGKGISQALMNECARIFRERGAKTIWLGVWESNRRAIAFYQKLGFRKVGAQPFLLGQDLQSDDVMQVGLEELRTSR